MTVDSLARARDRQPAARPRRIWQHRRLAMLARLARGGVASGWLAPASLAAVAGLATWVATRHGPGLSPDSVTYISAARNLAAGHGYVDLTGQANTTFAPGFSAMLAAGQWLGLSVLTAARALNAGAFAGIVLLSWVLVRRHVDSRTLALVTTGLIACSPALLNVTDEAWSEPLFCVLLLLFVLVIEDAIQAPIRSPRLVAWAGAVAGFAFLIRYAALALFITGVLALVAFRPRLGLRARLWDAAVFTTVGAVLPALWIARNATSHATYLLGPRVVNPDGVDRILTLWLGGIKELVVPTTAVALWALLALPTAALMAFGLRAVVHGRHDQSGGRRSVVPLVAFVGVYSVFIVVSGKLSGSSVDSRTVMPVYVPLVLLGSWLVSRAADGAATTRWRRLVDRRVLLAVGGAALAFYVAWFTTVAWSDGQVGRGYAAVSVVHSALARRVRRLPPGAVVITNAPWALYFASGHQPVEPQPGPLGPASSLVPPTVDELADRACSAPVYVAWYGKPDAHATRGRLPARALQRVQRLADGTLYRVDGTPGQCSPGPADRDGRTSAARTESPSTAQG